MGGLTPVSLDGLMPNAPDSPAQPTLEDVAGLRTHAVSGAIKRPSDTRPDVCVLATDAPASFASLTTTSTAAAASCLWTRSRTPGLRRAVVVNSGNANAATGPQGVTDNAAMAAAVAAELGCAADEVLVCSTGVIGVPLPMERLLPAVHAAASGAVSATPGAFRAADAILTTDTASKEAGARTGGFTIAGIAKGSGMIHPGMATMLAFVATDASIGPSLLQELLRDASDQSFHQISVDGDMSTNDTVVLIATGAGEAVTPESAAWEPLKVAVHGVCRSLARQIAADGEGARTLLSVVLDGASDDATARRLARSVVSSSLVKAAVHGCDPNWGRIVGALGQAGAPDLDQLDVSIGGIDVMRGGVPLEFDEAAASEALGAAEVRIELRLPGAGHGEAWGCDLSAQYVAINADYRT